MEPMTIAVSVVGLLGATVNVSKVLTKFIEQTKNAPSLADRVLSEVLDINASLSQLQGFLTGVGIERQSRKRLVMMDQVVVTLTTCVMAFLELEAIIDELNVDQPKQPWARIAWARQESAIKSLLERLQFSKISLTLMLTTLTCASVDDATTSVEALASTVQELLQTNQEISARLNSLENMSTGTTLRTPALSVRQAHSEDDKPTIIPSSRYTRPSAGVDESQASGFGFDFDTDLYQSWVYTRALRRKSSQSVPSSAAGSFGWSCLSELSMANVSNISVFSLPLTGRDLSNSAHYGFNQPTSTSASRPWQSLLFAPYLHLPSSYQSQARNPSLTPKILLWGRHLSSKSIILLSFETCHERLCKLLALGTEFSGKTTIHKQLQMLHGYPEADRVAYRSIILKDIVSTFLSVLYDRQEILHPRHGFTVFDGRLLRGFSTVRPPLDGMLLEWWKHEQRLGSRYANYVHFPGEKEFQSCIHACREMAQHDSFRQCVGSIRNTEYFLDRFDVFLEKNYVPSDCDILHAWNGTLDGRTSDIILESTQHTIIDPGPNVKYSIHERRSIIFTVALTLDGILTKHAYLKGDTKSKTKFKKLCEKTEAPIVLLFTRLDLFLDHFQELIDDEDVLMTSWANDPYEAGEYLADSFQVLDRRPQGELHIYFVNAVDPDNFGCVFRDMCANVSADESTLVNYPRDHQSRRIDRRQSMPKRLTKASSGHRQVGILNPLSKLPEEDECSLPQYQRYR